MRDGRVSSVFWRDPRSSSIFDNWTHIARDQYASLENTFHAVALSFDRPILAIAPVVSMSLRSVVFLLTGRRRPTTHESVNHARRKRLRVARQIVVRLILIGALSALAATACGGGDRARQRISPEYDSKTGRLTLLKYDSNGNGVVDTWSYMDGARVIRIEIDQDEDGKIDRWEYYDAAQKLEKVGLSRQHDGVADAWQHFAADGSVDRMDISARRDGVVTRTEHFDHGRLLSAEEDTDGDGRIDKWETYSGDRLASVAFDSNHRGSADRRLQYLADGSVRVEVDPVGDGHFVPADSAQPASRRR